MITVRDALNQAIDEEMSRDKNVFLMGEDIGDYEGSYKITQRLLKKFGDKRVIDTPISEHGFAGLAVGSAFAGLKPIVEFMTFNFAMQAIDHIVNSAAKTLYMSAGDISCPIVFRGPNGVAAGVGAQHSQNYAAWYSHVPGLKVIAPYSATDAKFLLKEAIQDPNPVIFLEDEILYGVDFDEQHDHQDIKIGHARKYQEGKDVTVVSFSKQMSLVLDAATEMQKENVSVEVIDIRTIKPLDEQMIINSVIKTNRLVIVEEGWFFSGVGASIASTITTKAFDYLDAPVKVVSGLDVPMPYAPNLEALAVPSKQDVISAIREVLYM